MAKQYATPDVLVSTAWVDEHKNDPNVRVVESDEDLLLYSQGHVPGAVKIDWQTDLQDQLVRDYIDRDRFAELCRSKGIANDTTVVFYGDKSNWWATYALWVFKLYGHDKCLIMNGGRKRWELDGRPWSRDPEQAYARTEYTAQDPDKSIRAFRDEVLKHQKAGKPLVDVRSPGEFTGEMLHMPDYPQEGALRGGHIPGAKSVPWARAVNEDGTFKPAGELEKLYCKEVGLKRRGPVIAYCRIGERSSHTWFVLKYLLGFPNVKNYDGSWTEWGNTVGVPIAKGTEQDTRVMSGQSIAEKLDSLAGEFQELEPRERLELLLEFAEALPPLPSRLQAERDAGEHRVHECQTPVFIWVEREPSGDPAGRVRIHADVAPEAPTVKGFVGILVDLFSGAQAAEILALDQNLVQRFGLLEALGMMRMRGLQAIAYYIRKQVARLAEAS